MKTQQKIFNLPKNKKNRVKLRVNQTEPDRKLWQAIRGKQLGVKFRRQQGIGNYIVDFYCPEKKIVIELDGDSHFDTTALQNDRLRDEVIRALGLEVVRYTNNDVMENLANVLQDLSTRL
jgi:very-short-patch-repair endonuclease